MPGRRTFLLGKHVSVMTLTPQSEASNGTMTAGTPIALINAKKGLRVGEQRQAEDISHDGSGIVNEVVLAKGFVGSITAMVETGTSVATLRSALAGTNTVTIDATVNSNTLDSGYYTLLGFNIESTGRGPLMLTVDLGSADVS